MANIDPAAIIEWLTVNEEDKRDEQLLALEQLCMSLLMSDNVNTCFIVHPPHLFVPALSQIFLDESAPDNILEATARALTYFLDLSADCTKRIIGKTGALKAICDRLIITDTGSRINKDLAEQCCKMLELICTREARAVFRAGGLSAALLFIGEVGSSVYKDALYSAMTIVSKLCNHVEPNEPSLPACIESLSKMLKHDDTHISSGALKCFVSISDRFARSNVDPAPLVQHGLLNELLLKLSLAVVPTTMNIGTAGSSTTEVKSSQSPSTVIDLLTTLCRDSESVSYDLFRSNLADAIEKALEGDENCRLDIIRFVDLLLVLLTEGRSRYIKDDTLLCGQSTTSVSNIEHVLNAEKSHRHLVEYIRNKDNDALMEAIDSSTIDINFVDEAGQTLLNWASAFGTEDMVEYLCSKGADVNKGLRSSSLHYAAWFGRTFIAKILLEYGADPNFRDEAGKTPLDKAREKIGNENHEIFALLESPEWTMSSENETVRSNESKGDPEMAEIYLKRFMVMFCHSFQSTMSHAIKGKLLSSIKEMVYYIKPDWLKDLCKSDGQINFAPLLVEVLAIVLDTEADDSHVIALKTMYSLLNKCQDIFLDHFASLGVFCEVQRLIDIDNNSEKDILYEMEDTDDILPGQAYHWNNWFICRGKDSLYIWNNHVILEFSNGSNGWFRFVMNNRLSTMYSSGHLMEYHASNTAGGLDQQSAYELERKFIEKYLNAKELVEPNTLSLPILSKPSVKRLEVGTWLLISIKRTSLCIQNFNSIKQFTTIKCEKFGFSFQSNDGKQHRFIASMPLKDDTDSGWESIKKANPITKKSNIVRKEIRKQAQKIYDTFFKAAQAQPRNAVIRLGKIVTAIEFAISNQSSVINDDSAERLWALNLSTAMSDLKQLLLEDEGSVSTYEIYSSGLVEVLLEFFKQSNDEQNKNLTELQQRRINIFVKCFKENKNDKSAETCASVLVQKLISVLESIERLPVYLYNSSGAFSGLQILSRYLNFRMEMATNVPSLIDRTGRGLRMEPLTTVDQLEKHLLNLIVKKWYDQERATLAFVKKLNDNTNLPMEFKYEYDFDQNGVIYWVGTNGKTSIHWVNPGQHGLMIARSSEGRILEFGIAEDILERSSSPKICHTNDDENSWISIDLGLWLIPTNYTIRLARSYYYSSVRNWLLQMSKDGINWTTLCTHIDDTSLNEAGDTATWPIEIIGEEVQGWRYIRIKINGADSSGSSYYISLSGFEIYGSVTGVCNDIGTDNAANDTEACLKHRHHTSNAQLNKEQLVVGEQDNMERYNINGSFREQSEITKTIRKIAASRNLKNLAIRSNHYYSNTSTLPEILSDRSRTDVSVASRSESIHDNFIATMRANEEYQISVRTDLMNSYDKLKAINVKPFIQRPMSDMPSTSNDETQQNISNNKKNSSADDLPVLERVIPTCSSSSLPPLVVDTLETDSPFDNKTNSKDKPISTMHHNTSDTSKSQIQGLSTGPITEICNMIDSGENNETGEKRNNSIIPNITLNASPVSQENVISSVQKPLAETYAPNQMHKSFDQDISDNDQNQDNHMSLLQVPTISLSGIEAMPPAINISSSSNLSDDNTSNNSSSTTTTIIPSRTFYASNVINGLACTSTNTEQSVLDSVEYERNSSSFAEIEDEEIVEYNEESLASEDTHDYHEYLLSRDALAILETQAFEINERQRGIRNANSDGYDNSQNEYTWNDEYVLKAELTALIPGFDPRPGHTNIHQTSDLLVVAPSEDINDEISDIFIGDSSNVNHHTLLPRLKLTLKGPNLLGVKNEEVELKDSTWTIFHAIQKLAQLINYRSRQEKCKRIWEPTYTIIYEESTDEAQRADVGPDNKWDSDLPIFSTKTQLRNTGCTVDHVLQLLWKLHNLSINPSISLLRPYTEDFVETHKKDDGELINSDIFYSKKITSKLVQQIQDPLVLSSNTLPSWCDRMILSYSFLFPFETRHLYFNCTSFGSSRSIVWLQTQQDRAEANMRSSLLLRRRNEFRESRLQRDRVRIPRGENTLAWGKQIISAHIDRQTVLEVEFIDEEGTGLGPTLEFYSLIAAEFQRKDLCMWICNDEMHDETNECSSSSKESKPPGYYVVQSSGLFPAPLPQDSPCCDEIVKHFWYLGVFVAKALQDNRIIPLPLSLPFLKLLIKSDELSNVLNESDLFEIDKTQALFIKQLKKLIVLKEKIFLDQSLNDDEKSEQIEKLQLQYGEGKSIHLESLALTMIYLPSSCVFPFSYINLIDGGFDLDVNMNNLEQYVNLFTDFIFNTGIKRQIEALKAGFSRVFSIKKLNAFTPLELRRILCGEQEPEWTREDLFNYTIPKLGYNKESPGFVRFLNVLELMDSEERKSFLQFTTGCPTLPPGGLANLTPRLTVVRKVDAGTGSFPSVNTCVHYLKLPEYPDEETLRERLLTATLEKRFLLN